MPDEWQPGFNDPTVIGWLATFGYLAAAGFALVLGRRYRPDKTAVVWFTLGAGLLLLCLNKQLDLQSWLRFTGRDFTQEHGLYQFKNPIRYGFMALLVLLACVPLVLLRVRIWALLSRAPGAALGLALIGLYIVVRGANYDGPVLPYDHQWIIEAAGLALVLWSFGGRVMTPRNGQGPLSEGSESP